MDIMEWAYEWKSHGPQNPTVYETCKKQLGNVNIFIERWLVVL